MQVCAASHFSVEPDSLDAGRFAGEALVQQFAGETLNLVLVYATTNHDQEPLLRSLREALGPAPKIVGCSVQGVVGNDELTEEGLALAVMGFGGSRFASATAVERDISLQTEDKGISLARRLKAELGREPRLVVVLYDPLCGANVEALVAGMRRELSCQVIGGGAGQPWGPPVQTFQYWGEEVLSHGAVAIAIDGPFEAEVGICHGTSPTGLSMTITKTEGTQILEIDGKPARDVWYQTTGLPEDEIVHQSYFAAWAIGIQQAATDASSTGESVIRGAFGFDPATGGVIMQAAIPEGARVMLHHRTVENVLSGTEAMASDLAKRVSGRKPWAVLGFECAARTFPFLGESNTLKEHRQLRGAVAPAAPWLGMMAWGEIGPSAGRTAFHNYTFPLVVLTEEAA